MRNNNNTKRKNGRWKQPSGGVPHKKEAGFNVGVLDLLSKF